MQIYNFIILGDGYLLDKAKIFINANNIKNVYLFGKKNDVFKYLYEEFRITHEMYKDVDEYIKGIRESDLRNFRVQLLN